jgi:dihydropteroate synthase
LFRALPALAALGHPLVVGVSRKKMIGDLTGRGIGERAAASVAAALLAAQNGASVLRVHDVKETVDAIRLWKALMENDS